MVTQDEIKSETTRDPKAEELVNQAEFLFYNGRYQEAISLYEKALKIEPDWERVYEQKKLAIEYLQTGHIPRDVLPPEAAINYGKAMEMARVERYDIALDYLERAKSIMEQQSSISRWRDGQELEIELFREIEAERSIADAKRLFDAGEIDEAIEKVEIVVKDRHHSRHMALLEKYRSFSEQIREFSRNLQTPTNDINNILGISKYLDTLELEFGNNPVIQRIRIKLGARRIISGWEGDSYENNPTIVETHKRLVPVNDQPNGPDQLGYIKYANAFSDLITNPETNTPITIGVYGEWGSGKSFLMGKIKEQVLAQQKKIRKPDIDIHIINFNAWVYSGSEHLWASLVTHLYRDIEKHFGWKAHWMRLGKAIQKSLPKALGVFAFYGILGLGFSFLLNFNQIQSTSNNFGVALTNAVVGSLIGGSALASLPVLWSALKDFFDSLFLSQANKLQNLAARPDFRNKIGIMADIKDEIKFIRELLKAGKNGKPTRLVLFIDDLDRCEHSKTVEVLQAIMLLLADEDGSPFVIFLGLDARVVVHAIEEHYGEVLVKGGINGYDYLEKIIQLPFVIPKPEPTEIKGYIESLLWGSEEEKDTVKKAMARLTQQPETTKMADAEQGKETSASKIDSSKSQVTTLTTLSEAKQPKGKIVTEAESEKEVPVTFTWVEREALKACVNEFTGNPRKIKRIINIYRLARLLFPADLESSKAIRWIVLTEQWPYHMAWIIEHIDNGFRSGNLRESSLLDMYRLARKDIYTEGMETLLGMDADPNLFEKFIQQEPIFSILELKVLLSLTFNLNPAIRSEVSKQMLKASESKPKKATSKKKTLASKAQPA